MTEYLSVVLPGGQSIGGDATATGYTGDFVVTSADSGPTYTTSGDTIFQPFAVTLESTGTPGINALLAAASAGTSPLAVTLYTTTGGNTGPIVITGQISLTGATIVEAQTASGASALAFDYSSITVTPYTANQVGSYTMGTPVTTTVPDTASFSAPTPQEGLSLFTGKSLLLNVSDDPGSSQITYFTSDFQVRSYQFAVGSNGDAGPVVIDFGGKSDTATGVAQLDTDLTSNHVIPSLTLYVEKTNGGEVTTDQVTFTDAVVSNYADSNHDVTVTFDFQSATLQSVLELTDGKYVSDGTTTIPGDITICYLAGTRILTPTGEVCVETLARGDRVVTRFGGLQRIKWIGRQSYSAAALPAAFGHERREHIPVHLRPGSLGDGLPARDLYVSPGHSMLVDDTLVLAQSLVNGRTITQNECPACIDYYQIELERHDCVIAEGTWSETYADWEEGRRSFHNAAEFHALFPDYHSPQTPTLCAPRPERGAALEAVLRPIVARAAHQATPGPLNGFIDRVRDDYKLDGWAHDASHPELPVLLEILLEGKVIGTVLACDYRKDLLQAGYGQGRCSFTFISPIKLRTAPLATLQVRRAVDGAAVRVSRSIIDAAFEPAILKPRLAIVA